MNSTKTSTISNGLIWFGASVSIAEIMTGTLLAPLGFTKGIMAIIIGHIIGCFLFYLAGLIGARTQKSSMETVKIAFGEKGSILFSSLNIIQLVGWTAVMIFGGMTAANTLMFIGGTWVWGLILGVLIICWVFIGLKNFSKINVVAMSLLFVLTVVLSVIIFRGDASYTSTATMPFGLAVEWAAIMPLSWLPLIADYTRNAKNPILANKVSTLVYFIGSSWMYIIGLGAAIFTAQSDVGQILLQAGLGIVGLLIIIFSTATTAFLDAFSAGVSSVSIFKNLNEKMVAIVVAVLGTIFAIFTPITQFQSFLFFIGSVFAPMIAVLITNYFILRQDYHAKAFSFINLGVWFAGFLFYRYLKELAPAIGTTLPVIVATMVLCIVVHKLCKTKCNKI